MKRVTSVLMMIIAAALMPAVIYVDDNAAGSNNGTSWTDAYTLLQPALNAAVSGDQIWVASGTYKPTYDYGLGLGDRGMHFRLKNGVAIYGGFAGNETLISQRNKSVNETILSGDIGSESTNYDNCYHVFYHPDGLYLDSTAVLDGFYIKEGCADFAPEHNSGAGIFNYTSSPTIIDCTFLYNRASGNGAGMYNSMNSSPSIIKCDFSSNSALTGIGGGMFNIMQSNPLIKLTWFGSNRAQYGGALSNDFQSNPVVENSVFVSNEGISGGAINNYSNCSPVFINCTISQNTSDDGGGIFSDFTSTQYFYNCIIWGNTAENSGNEIYNASSSTIIMDYSCYGNDTNDVYNTGSFTVTNSISSDPLFEKFNYPNSVRPYGISPCVDTGSNSYNESALDYNLWPRIVNSTIDMGAYEWTSGILTNPTVFVNANAAGTGTGKNWTNACTTLQAALDIAGENYHIWVAAGTYKPSDDYGLGIGDRGKHFRMKNWVSIYGGFIGTEVLLSQRNSTANSTILSGDIGVIGDNSDNCFHLFYHPDGTGLNSTAVLDGFTLTGGKADSSSYPHFSGGAVHNDHSSPSFRNCIFSGNNASQRAGAVHENNNCSSVFDNCLFSDNTVTFGVAGAVYVDIYSNTVFKNSRFSDNFASSGGAVYVDFYCSPVFYNCLFSNNTGTNGGAVRVSGTSYPVFKNCTVTANTADNGGGISNIGSSVSTFENCIIYGNNASVSGKQIYNTATVNLNKSCYINLTGDIYNTGSINSTASITQNPRFANSTARDYRLYGISPCVNLGDNSYNAEPYDLRGQARIQNGTIDMGAYEWTVGVDPAESRLYVNWSAAGSNNGSSWTNAFNLFQSALDTALPGDQIWVAAGTYNPSYDYGLGIGDRGKHFRLINGVAIYGGFAGSETFLYQRNITANVTVLSGDIGTPMSIADNCYHVFYHPDGLYLDNTAVLDGFSVSYGNASGTAPHCYGGGIYNNGSSPALSYLKINYNSASNGGGVYNENSAATFNLCNIHTNNASVSGGGIFNSSSHFCDLTGSSINYNTAQYYGGGVYNLNTENTSARCFYYYNTAVLGGGAVCNDNSVTTLSNNLIVSNSSVNEGGGIMDFGSNTTIKNCTISGNSTEAFGGGLYSYSSSAQTLYNTIVWGNTSVKGGNEIFVDQYSSTVLNCSCYGNETDDIYDQDGTGFDASNKNISDNPRFVNPPLFLYNIYAFSPCFDAGDSGVNTESYDLGGRARIQNDNIDMGAYEWTDGVDPANINAPSGVTITVNGSGQRELNWQSVYEALEYIIYRSELPYSGFSKIATSVSNQYIDTEVLPGKKYFYYIAAESGK